MAVKILLKNSPKTVLIDDFSYKFITENEYLKKLNFSQNLREHSSGCAVFQKSWRMNDGKYKTETVTSTSLLLRNF